MTPGVDGNVVLADILRLKDGREGNGTGTNDKERRLERILVKEVQEVGSVICGSIIVCKPPGVLCGTIRDVSVANTPTTRPPTTSGVCSSLCIVWTPSRLSDADIRDLNTGGLNLGNPLLNQCGVSGRDNVQLGVIRGNNGRNLSSFIRKESLISRIRTLTRRQPGSIGNVRWNGTRSGGGWQGRGGRRRLGGTYVGERNRGGVGGEERHRR